MLEVVLAVISFLLFLAFIVFLVLYFRTKSILDKKLFEAMAIRDESIGVLDAIKEDLASGRVLLKIERIDSTNLFLRR